MAEISATDIARAAAAVVKTFPEGRYFMDGTEVSYLRDGHVHIEYETDGSGIKVYVLFDEDPELVFELAGCEQLAFREGRWMAHLVEVGEFAASFSMENEDGFVDPEADATRRIAPIEEDTEPISQLTTVDDGIQALSRFAPIDDARIFPAPPVDPKNPEELELYMNMLMIDHNDGRHQDKRNNYCPGCAANVIDEAIGKNLWRPSSFPNGPDDTGNDQPRPTSP